MNTIKKMKTNILMDKNGMKIVKLTDNEYTVAFAINNNQFNLPSIINFDMVKLIFDLNPDIYEKSILRKNVDLDNAIICSLMKDIYSDLGIPQSYICMSVDMVKFSDVIKFKCNPVHNNAGSVPVEFSEIPDLYLLPIKNMIIDCNILTNHNIQINCQISVDTDVEIEPFIEKMVIAVVNKIFIRLKQFIENLSFNNSKVI
jgi:hypothetical protein